MSKSVKAKTQRQHVPTLAYKPRVVLRPVVPAKSQPYLPRSRKIPLILGSISAACIPLYAIYVYIGYRQEAKKAQSHNVPLDVSDRYQRNAETYDQDIEWQEYLMGITKLRKKLAAKATGNILEVSVGTGRNAPYYPLTKGVKSVTMIDQSSEMIRMARMNWPKTCAYFINASFWIQSATEPVPCPSPEGFDTVIQTMGICSTPEPEKVLRNLGNMTKQETGRIFLLEHGKAHYEWLNTILDNIAPAHADRHGCWFNKDIGKIVEDSGLEVVEAKRYHFGTTWWFELKPPKRQIIKKSDSPLETAVVLTSSSRPWWATLWK